MIQPQLRWLLDSRIPAVSSKALDAVHANALPRTPGPVALREATSLDRVLVTDNQDFRGPWAFPLEHAGVVVFDHLPTDASAVERNLGNLAFRLHQFGMMESLAGMRFVVKVDRCLSHLLDDGTEHDLEPWKEVRLQEPAEAAQTQ
jgi:hypothetical protein